MTRLQEAIGLGLILGVIHGLVQSAGAVPVVPNFTIANPGEAFQFTQTYMGPGMTNQTVIQRTTEVTSVTDTTSVFTQ